MLDLRVIRDDPDRLRASQRARGERPETVDELLAADRARRESLAEFERLRAEQKALGKQIPAAQGDEKQALLDKARHLAAAVKTAGANADGTQEIFDRTALELSNLIEDVVPAGGEDDYVVLHEVGQRPEIDQPRDHLELGEGLRAIDVVRGAKVSGSRFYYLTGVGAQLELGILNLAMAKAMAAGFTAVITPTLVRPEIMGGTGFLGAHSEEVYRLEADDLYLVGTSEVPLAGYHADEILDLTEGPLRYAGWSACYRREAGSHGRDTRGIIRVHQFQKVEMFSYCREEDAGDEHRRLLTWQEEMLAAVELPYRVIDVAAGDLGSSAARKFDCEAWLPSQQRWMEVTSASNCTTFQARRLAIRERTEHGTRPVATLNGTLGTTRWIVALLENHQQPDGSVRVPAALQPYLGGRDLLEPVA
ncbi:MAG TPA: serine--tRNA ligase [Jiangellaceae bacterium]|nr:serine--tRNA ligase [Jiangellaceae bacterium]